VSSNARAIELDFRRIAREEANARANADGSVDGTMMRARERERGDGDEIERIVVRGRHECYVIHVEG